MGMFKVRKERFRMDLRGTFSTQGGEFIEQTARGSGRYGYNYDIVKTLRHVHGEERSEEIWARYRQVELSQLIDWDELGQRICLLHDSRYINYSIVCILRQDK